MRVMLRLHLDCTPDAAWRALRDPAVFRAVTAPLLRFTSLEPEGFPASWPGGRHRMRGTAFGVLPSGDQVVDISFARRDGVRIVRDSGGALSGPLALATRWEHSMAVSAAPGGGTLYRDRLRISPFWLWPPMWVFWQWRGARIRRLARSWR